VADPNAACLYQDVATTPGTTYTLSFFYDYGQLATTASELLVVWGDPSAPSSSSVADFVNVDTSGAYVQYTGSVTATSTTSQLKFLGRQGLDFYSLDDVSLTGGPVSSVPEPTPLSIVLARAIILIARLLGKAANHYVAPVRQRSDALCYGVKKQVDDFARFRQCNEGLRPIWIE
jgi:hypothetical protein